jgi:hypothetical protein
MPQSPRPLFREHAWQHYLQKREKDILPHVVSPPIFVCAWILFGLIVVVGLVVATQRVPIQVDGSGIVLAQEHNDASSGSNGGTALLFLPASEARQVHVGERSQIQIGLTGPSYTTTIAQVEPGLLSPNDIYKRYGLNCSAMPTITEPSVVVHVKLVPSLSSYLYAGSPITAQVQIGTQRILSLPGLNDLVGV